MKTAGRASRARRVVGDILLVPAVWLTLDVAVVMHGRVGAVVRKAEYREIFLYELVLCAVLLLFALDLRFGLFSRPRRRSARAVGRALRVGVALSGAVIVFFCGRVICGGAVDTAGRADHAVVLGLALENGKPTADLLKRLDAAEAYLERFPEARLILTGGNADEPGRTEAAVMRELLTERGVPEARLILEDQSASTRENFRNIAGLIPGEEALVIISSDYHMDRAARYAAQEGFSCVLRLPAPSGFFGYGANMMTEVVLDLNDLLKGRF